MKEHFYCIIIGGGAADGERPAAIVTPAVKYGIT